jgi:hypothetical protein
MRYRFGYAIINRYEENVADINTHEKILDLKSLFTIRLYSSNLTLPENI